MTCWPEHFLLNCCVKMSIAFFCADEPSAFKVVQERSSQPFTEPGRRFPSGIVMQKIILREASKLRPENSQAMGSGIQPYRTVSRHREAMPKGRLQKICRHKLADPFE